MKMVMAQGIGAAVLAASLTIGLTLLGPASFTAARAACDPGDRIDATTAQMAAKRAQSAGYSDVRMEHKGCDNVWHGFAMKDGATGRVAVSPSGEVMPEGD
jgi:hypothetical protein